LNNRANIFIPLLLGGCFVTPLGIVLFSVFQRTVSHPEELLYFVSLPFLKNISNSALLSITVSGIAVICGSFAAYLYFTLKSTWQRTGLLFFSLIVFSISPAIYLVALTRYEIFNLLPVFLQIVIVLTINMSPLPFAILVFTAGTITQSSLDVAFLSAHPGQVYRKIILPQLSFPLMISGLIIFMLVFKHHEVPSFLGYRTYSEELLNRIVVMSDPQHASIASLPFLALGSLIVSLLIWMISKSHLLNLVETYCLPLSLIFREKKTILLFSVFSAIFAFPVIFFKTFKYIDFSSLHTILIENIREIQNSLSLAVVSALIGTIAACYLYTFFKRINSRLLSLLGVAILLFYWLTPSSLIDLGLIEMVQLFKVNSIALDILALLFGYQTNLLPIALFILCALQLIKKDQDNTILKELGISNYNIFTKIIFPQNWPIWLITATILSVFALNDLSTTVLLIPPGIETVVIKIYNLMHYGDYSLVGILSLVQVFLVSTLVLFTAGVISLRKT
jgi:iron(III) transport system permease protein